MHIRFVHQPPLRIGPVCLKISSLQLPSRDKNIHLTRVLLLVRHKPGANMFQRSTSGSFFAAFKTNKQEKMGVLPTWSCSHADRFLHVPPLETDPLKVLQEKESTPPGRLRWTQMTLTCGFISKYRKKKWMFTGIDNDADVGLQWQRHQHYPVSQTRLRMQWLAWSANSRRRKIISWEI